MRYNLRQNFVVKFFTFTAFALFMLAAVELQARDVGLKGPPEGVRPVVQSPGLAFEGVPPAHFEVPLGFEISKQHHEELKIAGPPPFPVGGSQIVVDSNITPVPSEQVLFPGPEPTFWIPYDAAVAVGPNHVVAMVNASWAAYNKAGTLVKNTSFTTWWGTSGIPLNPATPFDPKCYYDPSLGGHFVLLATSSGNNVANMYVSVSQTDDPTGLWWSYTFDWRLDGTVLTKNWGDYPGLGYSDSAIYINANQYRRNSFQYSKVRVLSKAALYTGASATYTDFIRMTNADGTLAFTVKPARCLSASASEYLINTRPGGGSSVTLWRIDGAPSAPVLTRVAGVSTGSYAVPPDARQAGGSNLVATNDCRTQDVVWRNGVLYTAFTEGVSAQAALRYLEITSAGIKNKDMTYMGSTGIHLYYPAVTSDSTGNVVMVFNRSGSSEYISMYSTKMPSGSTSVFGSSSLLVAGNTYMIQSRWGDYSAIQNDDANNGAWLMAGTARNSSTWATDIVFASMP